jgi:hypothetical protein
MTPSSRSMAAHSSYCPATLALVAAVERVVHTSRDAPLLQAPLLTGGSFSKREAAACR